MKKIKLRKGTAVALLLLTAAACAKKENLAQEPMALAGMHKELLSGQTQSIVVNSGDTLLNATYESGTTNSGIIGVVPTGASAADAAYMVSNGANGSNYAIAHKVVKNDPAYYSASAYRSESDADDIPAARFLPGMERRYEFSLLLKDWEEYNTANVPHGDNIFQIKITGDAESIRFLTKRNGIEMRQSGSFTDNILADFRPYINQWIDFRIDVLWATNTTGYIKVYTRVPGQTEYTLKAQRNNLVTYSGDPISYPGQHGYVKWGVYREVGPTAPLTRIAYHDNVRIIKLPLQ